MRTIGKRRLIRASLVCGVIAVGAWPAAARTAAHDASRSSLRADARLTDAALGVRIADMDEMGMGGGKGHDMGKMGGGAPSDAGQAGAPAASPGNGMGGSRMRDHMKEMPPSPGAGTHPQGGQGDPDGQPHSDPDAHGQGDSKGHM